MAINGAAPFLVEVLPEEEEPEPDEAVANVEGKVGTKVAEGLETQEVSAAIAAAVPEAPGRTFSTFAMFK